MTLNLGRQIAIDTAARTIKDFSQKQLFLNTIYEKFFQGFSVKGADTHGIVYTPQPIVRLIGKAITVSLETVKLVSSLASLPILANVDM